MSKQEDPTMLSAAVKAYRDTFRFCPSFGRRKDIIETVDDLNLWKEVLSFAKERKWNPLRIEWILSLYEQRLEDINQQRGRTTSYSQLSKSS